jgi:hypothetical protein
MKKQRVVFLKKQKGQTLMGVTSLQFVREGSRISPDHGGGFVGSMVYKDGMIEVRKVDAECKPLRKFGSVMQGEKRVDLEADCVIFPAHLCEVMLAVDEDDEAPAKPIQQVQQKGK